MILWNHWRMAYCSRSPCRVFVGSTTCRHVVVVVTYKTFAVCVDSSSSLESWPIPPSWEHGVMWAAAPDHHDGRSCGKMMTNALCPHTYVLHPAARMLEQTSKARPWGNGKEQASEEKAAAPIDGTAATTTLFEDRRRAQQQAAVAA